MVRWGAAGPRGFFRVSQRALLRGHVGLSMGGCCLGRTSGLLFDKRNQDVSKHPTSANSQASGHTPCGP